MCTLYIPETSGHQITAIVLNGQTWQVECQYNLDDVARFMYEHEITTATLGGHGAGGKVALATACYHMNRTTGYFGIATTPMDQYYFEATR